MAGGLCETPWASESRTDRDPTQLSPVCLPLIVNLVSNVLISIRVQAEADWDCDILNVEMVTFLLWQVLEGTILLVFWSKN